MLLIYCQIFTIPFVPLETIIIIFFNKCPDYKNDDKLISCYKSFEFTNNSGIGNKCFCEILTSLLLLNGDVEILRIKTMKCFCIHVQIGPE